ncbi:MAG: SEC-C metal-binding domain-containing protein [Pseudomonadota bacterium]
MRCTTRSEPSHESEGGCGSPFTSPSFCIALRRSRGYGSDPNRWRLTCVKIATPTTARAFEPTSKRRRGFPSETRVKRGDQSVKGGDVELVEKLGRNDPCPCGSGRRFQAVLSPLRAARRH